jgi:hypothetical protein
VTDPHSRHQYAASAVAIRPFAMLGHRACGKRTDEVRSAAFIGPAARRILLTRQVGETAPYYLDPEADFFLPDDR